MPSVQPCMPHPRPAVRSFVVRWARPPNPYLYYLTLPAFSQAYGIPLVLYIVTAEKPPGVPTSLGTSRLTFLFCLGQVGRFSAGFGWNFFNPTGLTYVRTTVLFCNLPLLAGPHSLPNFILFYFTFFLFLFFSSRPYMQPFATYSARYML
ncbi:hypothetical protein ASPFODRAFT_573563 [Aspergillus luchuensis CBS 106.47]|uniref:Uncharacterized protein n=1 Tax=Aspergillus luchuensis (strain CBS 106.47) TaxID=1137211 RepID=A0A1M3TLF1_ASPLC|nr:hypothetical protein ASPFODRAFT_573563 [Aspergillus luchuensis CBS 106.47]